MFEDLLVVCFLIEMSAAAVLGANFSVIPPKNSVISGPSMASKMCFRNRNFSELCRDYSFTSRNLVFDYGLTLDSPVWVPRPWMYAIVSTLIISLVPLLVLLNLKVDANSSWLRLILASTSGALLGDAFLHLLPMAFHPDDTDPAQNTHLKNTIVGIWVLLGSFIFLVIDKVVRVSHQRNLVNTDTKHSEGEWVAPKFSEPETHSSDNVQIGGYLNFAADFAHNFTDGLAIGATYMAGNSLGFWTSLVILCHEIPHEIGDFALLVRSGCPRTRALQLQFATAAASLAGCLLSLAFGGQSTTATGSWMIPFTAGAFIYIGTVTIIPDLLKGATKNLRENLSEVLAIFGGVALMFAVAHWGLRV